VGTALMPSGTYLLTQPEVNNLTIAMVKSEDGLTRRAHRDQSDRVSSGSASI
jgi:hypothetical protein